jgi:hypothetical protein
LFATANYESQRATVILCSVRPLLSNLLHESGIARWRGASGSDHSASRQYSLTTNSGAPSVETGRLLTTKKNILDQQPFLVIFTYVEKRAIHLIRRQFVFYRADREWRLNSYVWDENVAVLFD